MWTSIPPRLSTVTTTVHGVRSVGIILGHQMVHGSEGPILPPNGATRHMTHSLVNTWSGNLPAACACIGATTVARSRARDAAARSTRYRSSTYYLVPTHWKRRVSRHLPGFRVPPLRSLWPAQFDPPLLGTYYSAGSSKQQGEF